MTVSTDVLHHGTGRRPFINVLHTITPGADEFDVMQQADLMWTVEQGDVYIDTAEGASIPVGHRKGTYRKNMDGSLVALDTVGGKYQILQNSDLLRPFSIGIEEGWLEGYAQAGWANDGRKVFVLAKMGEVDLHGDPYTRYIMGTTAHDGSGSMLWRSWQQLLWCTNQYGSVFSTRGQGIYRLHHTSSAKGLVKQAHAALREVSSYYDHYDEVMSALMGRRVTPREISAFIERLFPDKDDVLSADEARLSNGQKRTATMLREKRLTVGHLAMKSETTENVRGTAAALFHAAVEFSDYYTPVRGGVAQERRALRMLNGTDGPFKRRAADLAVALL